MAEAHSAVAFSFQVTHEGVLINYDLEVLNLVWLSGLRSWKKRFLGFINNFKNGIYPSSIEFLLFIELFVLLFDFLLNINVSFGLIRWASKHYFNSHLFACIFYGFTIWLMKMLWMRYTLKLLLMYKQWIYQSHAGKPSLKTRIWFFLIKLLTHKSPMLYSYQSSLPRLPLPRLSQTIQRYLLSIKPLKSEQEFDEIKRLAHEFELQIGKKLQLYLWLKSWWSSNYVSDWWEEFVYLKSRQSLMINSNFYGIDALVRLTNRQTSRAANLIYGCLLFRQQIDRQKLKPILLQNLVPLCSWQYERMFNTTRIPCVETDLLIHKKDSEYIVIHYKQQFYKLIIHSKGKLLKPKQIEFLLDKIIANHKDDDEQLYLSSLTSQNRMKWAKIRNEFFSKGINRISLTTIENAAFIVVLTDETLEFDTQKQLNEFGQFLLHGKGKHIWFDKSFNLIVARNGQVGFNGEHSWADAPIMAHLWEFIIAYDFNVLNYDENGKCKANGDHSTEQLSPAIQLKWEFNEKLIQKLQKAYQNALNIINDLDLFIYKHDLYGKGFMKKCKVSPDAFIQMALQLAYQRDCGHLCLTYEASMTRLYREGRTETVRPVTVQSAEWVQQMINPSKDKQTKIEKLKTACKIHQRSYQEAMCGLGVDRHLFCLFVVSKYLQIDSPFLNTVLSEPWKLSTSQSPHGQVGLYDGKNSKYISAGGGFGPVADDGYGVSYIIAGENHIFFHVSSKRSSPKTDSQRFAANIKQALIDMKQLFD